MKTLILAFAGFVSLAAMGFTTVTNAAAIVDSKIIDPVLISLMEALNNSIEHSYLEDTGNNIDVIVSVLQTKVEIDILETGIARTNFDKPQLQFDPEDLASVPEGGMGLFIIDSLMDSTAYTSQKGVNTTTFSKNLI